MIYRFKHFKIWVALLAFVASNAAALVLASGGAFAANGSWVNISTIDVGGIEYIDSNPLDDNLAYRINGDQADCVNVIYGFDTDNVFDTSKLGSATIEFATYDAINDKCGDKTRETISLDTQNADVAFSWVDQDNIEFIPDGAPYTRQTGTDIFIQSSRASCQSTVELTNQSTANFIRRFSILDECKMVGSTQIGIADPTEEGVAASTLAPGTGTGSAGTTTVNDDNNSCDGNGGPFGFILCAALNGLDAAVSGIDGAVSSLLYVDYDKYTETDGLKNAWSRFRNIAYILLVPVMLVMVIGTALGFSFVDAYTVKRALPRLLVAIIFMALSWDITRIMIEVSNGVGQGIAGLIGSAVKEGGLSDLELTDVFSASEGAAATGGAVAGLGIAGGIVALAIASQALLALLGYVLLFLATAFLALATALVLLSLRQMLILALVILAPIAIVSWIFPGNDKLWKLWWNSFSKLLLLFPVIILLTTTGKAFAYIIFTSGGPTNAGILSALVDFTLKIVAYIGPFFFIPALFKTAGAAFSNIAGTVNNKERGLFDRARKKRSSIAKNAYQHDVKPLVTQKRSQAYSKITDSLSNAQQRPGARLLKKTAARMVGGRSMFAADSAQTAAASKEVNEITSAGRDDVVRALTVNKRTSATRVEGGKRQYESLGGAWVDEAFVDEAHNRYGNNKYVQQAALAYEMRKAMETGQTEQVSENYHNIAMGDGGWGMTETEADGAMIGAGFENQNQSLEFKHMRRDPATGQYRLNYESFSKEMYEKKGAYAISQMSGNTINRLEEAYVNGDDETKRRVRAVAETFVHRGLAGGQQVGAVGDDGATPVYAPPTGGIAATEYSQVSSQGSGSVGEKVANLARVTGVLDQAPNEPFRRTGPGSDQKGQEPRPGETIQPGDPRYRG